MATCGSKHTLAIDTTGQLWYFGLKSSVGIAPDIKWSGQDPNEGKQMTPIKLETHTYEPFKYISSGDDHNLAITQSGKLYGFGRNQPFSKINSSSSQFVSFSQIMLPEKAILASANAQHSLVVDIYGTPYAWGNLNNGRCGISISNNTNNITTTGLLNTKQSITQIVKSTQEVISTPTVIQKIEELYQSEIEKVKEQQKRDLKIQTSNTNMVA